MQVDEGFNQLKGSIAMLSQQQSALCKWKLAKGYCAPGPGANPAPAHQ